MPVVIAHRGGGFTGANVDIPGLPKFNPMNLLHGEETLEVFNPIEPDTTVVVQDTLVDL